MKPTSLALSAFCLAGLSACVLTETQNDIDGRLTVLRDITVVDKDGSKKELKADSYDATIHMRKEGANLSVSLNLFSSVDLLFAQPVADQQGNVSVPAADSKQAFDLTGTIADNSSSFTENGSEQCIWGYNTVTECHIVYDGAAGDSAEVAEGADEGERGGKGGGKGRGGPGRGEPGRGGPGRGGPGHGGPGHGHGHEVCHTRQVPIYGHQYYTGTREITDRNVSLNFIDPASKAQLATFRGYYRMVDMLINKSYTSSCMP